MSETILDRSADRGSPSDALPERMADRIANLSPAKLRLLMRHLAAQRGETVAEPPELVRRDGDGPLPLSFSQQRLWFLDQLEPGSTAYALPSALRLRGRLDRAALAAALARLVARHEVLRATFEERDGAPVQRFHAPGTHPASRPRLPLVDASGLAADRASSLAAALARRDARRPFDLARGPLFRNLLVRLGDADGGEHVLLQNLHHIVSDGWSRTLLVRDMAAAYDALRRGAEPRLPALEVGYGDFCLWQRRWLRGEALDGMLGYWRRQLDGAPPELPLPTDRPRQARRSGAGAVAESPLPAALMAGLEELGRRHGATAFMTLLAGLASLLHRYTGATDLVLGSPIANRQDRRLEGVVGFFVNNLVLRLDAAGDPAFGELLRRVRETALAAYAHQDLPFDKLVEELAPERAPGRQPLFQGMFMLENVPPGRLELAGLVFEPVAADSGAAKFDWIFAVERDGAADAGSEGGWRLRVEYSAELFDRATVERWIDHLQRLLAAAVDAPETRLSRLPLLSASERRRLLAGWNRPAERRRGAGPSLVDLFAARAAERPGAPAISDGGRRTSYGELAARAWALAAELRRRGVRRGDRVALLVDRSAAQVAAILGVLAAGAAYLPLDPQAPPGRLADTLDDAAPALLVAGGEAAGRLRLGGDLAAVAAGIEVVEIATQPPGEPLVAVGVSGGAPGGPPADAASARPAVPLDGDDLAYVIYTSGSTGRPKGVGVSHRAVVRLLTATAPWFGFGAGDVWTLFHSYAFDFSVWELWGALAGGGRLVVVPHLVSRSPGDFLRLLRDEGVTVLNQTPSAFRQLVAAEVEVAEVEAAAGGASPPLALRWVIFGGEALDAAALAPWVERHGDGTADGGPRLVNMYGITETTVHVTYQPVDAAAVAAAVERAAAGAAPEGDVGVPIPDLQVHLLDRAGNPVPVGVAGEIHVGGAGLARGYLGRAARTAGRFVPDPFAAVPGRRLYRSGDLARRRADGHLLYLGRIDHQVQVRGFRVELGEIEAVLAEHPAVAAAVVLAEDGDDGPRLTAYVVAAAGAPPVVEEVRAALAARLPDYMLPAAFAVVDALPLNHNGKVDRAALAGLATTRLGLGAEPVAPRTPLEETLCRLWAEVLDRPPEEIGVHHDFFHLGGHSLLATRLVSRLRAELGVELPLATFFAAPTVAGLAEALEVVRWVAGTAVDGTAVDGTAVDGAAAAADRAGGDFEEGEL